MVLDEEHQHIFVPGSTSELIVLDYQGNVVRAIAGQPGAWGLALDPASDRLYVAHTDEASIGVINTNSLKAKASLPIDVTVSDLTFTAGRLWFACGPPHCLERLNPLTGEMKRYTGAQYPYGGFAASATGDPSVLVMWDTHGVLYQYDLSSGNPVMVVKKDITDDCCFDGISVDPLGTEVVALNDQFGQVRRFALPGLAALPGYPVSSGYSAVYSPDGQFFAASGPFYLTPSVHVFPKGSTQPLAEFKPLPGPYIARKGLAFTSDLTSLFAISSLKVDQAWLHILDAPTEPLPATDLSINVEPDPAPMGYPIRIESHLGFPDGSAVGRTVQYFMDDVEIGSAVTDANGDAVLELGGPPGAGEHAFQAYWPGEPGHRSVASAPRVVMFAVFSSNLTVDVSPDPAFEGDTVTISGTLTLDEAGDPSGRSIHLTRSNPDGSSTTLPDLISQTGGVFSTTDEPPGPGSYGYDVAWDGDTGHSGAEASASVEVRSISVGDDFNGDGYADMASGIVGEDVGGIEDGGAVSVIYGSSTGLTDAGNQFWTQDSAGIQDSVETSDFFGYAVAAGDFNADGFGDLAIGAADDDVGALVDGGVVNVLYGSAAGLTSTGNQLWTQDSSGILDSVEAYDYFGTSLTAGDLNGDGFADLAVGVANEDIGSVVDAGAMNIIYGSATGLTSTGNQFWSQDSTGILDTAETQDYFSWPNLSTGDLNGDGFDDVAVGVPWESIGTIVEAGAVNVILGSASGLTATGNQFWSQDSTDVDDVAGASDHFGWEVIAADFGRGPESDLAIGVPGEDPGGIDGAGAVHVLYGSPSGPTSLNDQFWTQNSTDVEGVAQAKDQFGNSLAAGDLGNSAHADLVIGAAYDIVNGQAQAGSFNVLYGSDAGLSAAGDQLWNQDSSGVLETSEAGDAFAADVWVGNYGFDAHADVVSNSVYEDLTTKLDTGGVNVFYGTPAGLSSTGNQWWTQNVLTILDVAESGDLFGYALA